MVIIKQNCKLCSQIIRENGEGAFRTSAFKHLREQHPTDFKRLDFRRIEAQNKFDSLKEEYNDLNFSYSHFFIKLNNFLFLAEDD